MKITLGNRELVIISATIQRTMDTAEDEWRCTIAAVSEEKDKELYDLVKPRSLAESKASINGQTLITGHKWITAPAITATGSALSLTGYSKTYPLILSQPKEQREYLEKSLRDISKEYCDLYGLNVVSDNVDSQLGEIFTGLPGVRIDAKQTIFSFLQNLARQRGILASSDEYGDLLYLTAKEGQKSVGSIIEGIDGTIPIADEFSATFDDTKIARTYQVVNDSPFWFITKEPQAISYNEDFGVQIFKNISYNSIVEGAGQKQIDFARNKALADSMSIPFRVNTWYAPNGELWRENTFVSVQSESLFIPGGYTFLIREVQYNLDSNGGETAVLSLVPPSLYTESQPDEPW